MFRPRLILILTPKIESMHVLVYLGLFDFLGEHQNVGHLVENASTFVSQPIKGETSSEVSKLK